MKKLKDIRGKVLRVGDIVFYPDGRAELENISCESFFYVAEYLSNPKRVWLKSFYWETTRSEKKIEEGYEFINQGFYNTKVKYNVAVVFRVKDDNDPPENVKQDMWTPDQRGLIVNGIIRLRP